jgi:hypothetical protein
MKPILEALHNDALEVRYFFMPWLKKILEEEERVA